jgi:hypothetical protein
LRVETGPFVTFQVRKLAATPDTVSRAGGSFGLQYQEYTLSPSMLRVYLEAPEFNGDARAAKRSESWQRKDRSSISVRFGMHIAGTSLLNATWTQP